MATKIHVFEYVKNVEFAGVDELEFPEAPIIGDAIELLDFGVYVVRNRKWVVVKTGEIVCRVYIVRC